MVEETTDKLELLRKAEEQVVDQFNKGDIGEDQLRAFQREIVKTEAELDDFESKLNGTEDNIEDVGDAAENSSDGFTVMGGALADLTASAIKGAIDAIGDFIGSLFELSEATEEYRTMQAKLEGSSKTFGYSVDFANGKYQEFYKYLGDDQMATNAITNLMGLGTSTENVSAIADGAIGVWASYGDSIPIESLTESINETVNAGKVTGTFADTINWAKDSQEQLGKALGGNKEAQKAYNEALKEGETAEDAFNAALATVTSEQERADIVAKFLNNTYGESKKTYDEMSGSILEANEAELALKETEAQLGETMAPVNTALTDLKNQALQAITPLVEKCADAFLNLLQWFKEHPTAAKILTAIVIALAAAFAVLAGALAIQGIITGVTKAIAFLNTTLLANPIVLIIAAIAALVAGFIYLWNNCEGFRNFWINLWEGIQNAASVCIEALKNFFTVTIPNIFNKVIEFVKNNWQGLLLLIVNPFAGAFKLLFDNCEGFRNFFTNLWEKIKTTTSNAINAVVTFFSQLPGKIGSFFANIINRVTTWASNLAQKARDAGSKFLNNVVNFFKQLPGRIWSFLSNCISRVTSWASSIVSKAKSAATKFVNSVVTFVKQLPGKIWTWLSNAASKVVSWGSNLASKGKAAAKKLLDSIVNKVKEIPSKLKSIGKNIVEGLWNGINNAKDWLIGKIQGFCGSALDGIKDFFGINSPSTLMRDEVGRYISEGVGVGITDNADKPIDALESLGSDIAEGAKGFNSATINRKLATTFSVGNANGVSDNSALLGKLDGIYERLNRLQVVLDGRTLVGEIIERVDIGLSDRKALYSRGG